MQSIFLYIDPSTGSMLFAILIGIIGALVYMVKSWIVKLRFMLSSGKKIEADNRKIPLVIFADDKRYWPVFRPVVNELDKRGIDVVYMTASEDDPVLKAEIPHLKASFIGSGNKAFARLNFLNASIVLSSTPGLDVYQWKRSKDVDYYIHILHACDGVLVYRMFGLDYYDGVFLSGEFQNRDLRALEELRGLKAKDLEYIGIPYMDTMADRLNNAPAMEAHERCVLLAPSWGPSSIFNKFGEAIIEKLLETGYHIIVRPHPQSFTSEKELMDKLMDKFPANEQLEWNRDNDNFEVLRKADILISDFSSVTFEFSLVYDKPVIYADTQFDRAPYDAWWLPDIPYWTFTALERIGMKLTQDNFDNIKNMIDECIDDPKFANGRAEVTGETWVHKGEGAVRAVDFLCSKYKELTGKELAGAGLSEEENQEDTNNAKEGK